MYKIAHKTRIHLNNKQSSWMRQNCIARRMAYNYAVEFIRDACFFASPMDIRKYWSAERDDRYPWMSKSRLVMAALNDAINVDFAAALNIWKKSGWSKEKSPKFQGRNRKLSVTFSYSTLTNKHIDGRTVKLPQKMGTAKLAEVLRFDGKIKKVTFSFSGGKWYTAFLIDVPDIPIVRKTPPVGSSVGVDMGIAHYATLSSGEHYDMPDTIKKLDARIKREQKRLSGMSGPIKNRQKAGRNWVKQKQRVAKLINRRANIRRNEAEHLSKDLAEGYELIAIEDLNVNNMSRSASGTSENPGKNVNAKSGMNREILNNIWRNTRIHLERKAQSVIAVNPAHTSMTCAKCNHVAKTNRVSQSEFQCVVCGHTENADVNAAQNILARALAQTETVRAG